MNAAAKAENIHDCDYLPTSDHVDTLVNRIVWKLDAALREEGHQLLTRAERQGFYSLAAASATLDQISMLPRMAQHEEAARARVLDLYAMFNPDPLEATLEIPVSINPETGLALLPDGSTRPATDSEISGALERFRNYVDANTGGTMSTNSRRQRGFTLIELMIVVAIIGMMAAIAIPAYREYTTRAQVSEGLNLVGGLKVGVAEYFAAQGMLPDSLETLGATAPSGKYVEAIEVVEGALVIRFGGEGASDVLSGKTVALAIGTANGQIFWQCGRSEQTASAEGTAIEWAADAASITTIEAKYLPGSCRG